MSPGSVSSVTALAPEIDERGLPVRRHRHPRGGGDRALLSRDGRGRPQEVPRGHPRRGPQDARPARRAGKGLRPGPQVPVDDAGDPRQRSPRHRGTPGGRRPGRPHRGRRAGGAAVAQRRQLHALAGDRVPDRPADRHVPGTEFPPDPGARTGAGVDDAGMDGRPAGRGGAEILGHAERPDGIGGRLQGRRHHPVRGDRAARRRHLDPRRQPVRSAWRCA